MFYLDLLLALIECPMKAEGIIPCGELLADDN